ncbi:hypothetical protein BJY00DRAFT_319725 [Aspergillus carlsbadensis]|nr:hypothetical protein BJY00DRAFT_319725 [Aspergillus carlsbadensis]
MRGIRHNFILLARRSFATANQPEICPYTSTGMGQSTGILVIANLTAVLFGQLGLSVTLQLGLSVVWAVCALLGCFMNEALRDGVGRIKLPGYGGYLYSTVMIREAVLQKFYLGYSHAAGQNAAVALYFIFIFVYGTTVDCAAYAYVYEIWPPHLRSQGTTIGLVSFFACAIAYTSPAPVAFDQSGWKYY